MIKSCFLKLVFCMALIMGLSCSFAFADEVSIVPSDEVYISAHSSQSGYTTPVIQEVPFSGTWPTSPHFMLGYNTLPDLTYVYNSSGSLTDLGVPIDRCYYAMNMSYMSDFTITYDNIVIELDLSDLPNGYYRYESDIYVGIALDGYDFLSRTAYNFNYIPSFIYPTSAVYISDSSSSMHCSVRYVDNVDFTASYLNSSATNRLVHFYLTSTFQYDSTYGSDVVFNLQPFLEEFSSFSFSMDQTKAHWNGGYVAFVYNNRFDSKLTGGVEPLFTPTPSPTPYPGQDTQESINQGVSNIEGQMNQLINSFNPVVSPIPTPADFTIDETLFDELETMTLPDISDTQSTYSALWDIFNPLWWILGLMFSIVFVIGIFLYVLRGGFI